MSAIGAVTCDAFTDQCAELIGEDVGVGLSESAHEMAREDTATVEPAVKDPLVAATGAEDLPDLPIRARQFGDERGVGDHRTSGGLDVTQCEPAVARVHDEEHVLGWDHR